MGAERIILPGVGSYMTGMTKLKDAGLLQTLLDYADSGKPILGICLGMQLLFDYSEEFGRNNGLSLIPGSITKIRPTDQAKVPHVGWNALKIPDHNKELSWKDEILKNVKPEQDCYFVHSYMAKTADDIDTIAETEYGGCLFSSVVRHENVYGCQFHPEKSGGTGLKILNNFINIEPFSKLHHSR